MKYENIAIDNQAMVRQAHHKRQKENDNQWKNNDYKITP
jgi:hypothetical protein